MSSVRLATTVWVSNSRSSVLCKQRARGKNTSKTQQNQPIRHLAILRSAYMLGYCKILIEQVLIQGTR